MDEEEKGWVDIKTNEDDNIAIRYDYILWRILVIIIITLKIIWQNHERTIFYETKRN